jgi:anthranilate phosphoribosyltransferase
MAAIRGGRTAAESASQVRAVLGGEAGAKQDMVLLNAGTALMAAGKAGTIVDGINLAREIIASGAALNKLDQLVRFSRS